MTLFVTESRQKQADKAHSQIIWIEKLTRNALPLRYQWI